MGLEQVRSQGAPDATKVARVIIGAAFIVVGLVGGLLELAKPGGPNAQSMLDPTHVADVLNYSASHGPTHVASTLLSMAVLAFVGVALMFGRN